MKKLIVVVLLWISVSAFAQAKPFIPKAYPDLPDNYGVKIVYASGNTESFEIASHRLNGGLFEFATKDDLWNWIPMSSVARVEFDKRFSKIMAIKEKEAAKNDKSQPSSKPNP